MNLFLDSNIWLSFYFLSREEIEGFAKLAGLVEEGRVTLFLPEQVSDEIRRNRDKVVAGALEPLTAEEEILEIPRLGEEYEEAEALRRALLAYRQARFRLVERILEEYGRRRLAADRLVDRLFQAARPVPVTDDVLARARFRYDRGNPPGKEGSYGDAVNWECLLAAVPDGEDLFFITRDSDFYARTSRDEFSPFLAEEWTARKRSRIVFFNRLSAFCCDQLPHLRFASEAEKEPPGGRARGEPLVRRHAARPGPPGPSPAALGRPGRGRGRRGARQPPDPLDRRLPRRPRPSPPARRRARGGGRAAEAGALPQAPGGGGVGGLTASDRRSRGLYTGRLR